ncbi:glycosyltransferase family 4 protein [Rhodococcus sp. NBC_00297]|uniref:glycosyltransferase family 4 protein n=1 Tax=Rhodococcus sp. NBC_00297 TaxID=2976005 RepID=UPI002E2CB16C|nr:glycosyltransferase family 1 protein [Rhodococcus sp. NBC_00297]
MPTNVRQINARINQHGLSNLLEAGVLATGGDVLITQNFTPIVRSVPTITFLHDLIFRRRPEFFSVGERAYFKLMELSLRRATALCTSSIHEANYINEQLRLPRQAKAVGLAVPSSFAEACAERPETVDNRPFLLSVGRLNRRKNIERLIETVLSMTATDSAQDVVLYIVGERDGLGLTLEHTQEALQKHVMFLGAVSPENLKWLYENCATFVFPSLDEGFGLPVVEALMCGAPIALSSIPAFGEFKSMIPASHFFDPDDNHDMARAITEAVGSRTVPKAEYTLPQWGTVVSGIRSVAEELNYKRRSV